MFKKFFACFVFLMVMVSSACAATSTRLRVEPRYYAGISEGHSDYSDARFGCIRIRIRDDDPANGNITGTLTLSGGNYLYYDGDELKRISGTAQTFTLIPNDDRDFYQIRNKEDREIRIALEDENGLEGVTVSWDFPARSDQMNGSAVITSFKTVNEQLSSFVPYFEYIRDGSKVTGIRWRIVNPSDTSTPLSQDFYIGMSFFDGRYNLEEYFYVLDDWADIEAGNTPEGVFSFDKEIEESEIDEIDLRINSFESGEGKYYQWNFYVSRETEAHLFSSYRANASLINGKADYGNAKFHSISIFPVIDNVIGELRCFTNSGSITIPGGGYTVIARDGAETPTILETVAAGENKTFGLIPDEESLIGSNYSFAYRPVYSNGEDFTLGGNAESNLTGKTLTWTFPAELSYLNGSGTIPGYKTVAEQLRTGVPYIEIVSADGNVTALNYRLVTSSDTSTAITPSNRTDFQFYVNTDASTMSGNVNDSASGKYTLSAAVKYEAINWLSVYMRSYDASGSYLGYTWRFYPASDDNKKDDDKEDDNKEDDNKEDDDKKDDDPTPAPGSPGSPSGGCNAGFTLAGFALTAALIRKLRKH